jgi:hypothetical protein
MNAPPAPPISYVFTVDDQINPVYCINCRTHIPRSVSNSGRGLCPSCIQSQRVQQAQQAAANQAALVNQQQAAANHQQAVFAHQTGLGFCPQCRSTNVIQIANRTPNGSKSGLIGAGVTMMIISVFCLWPLFVVGLILLIVGACQNSNNQIGTSRVCQYCGNRWAV